MITDFSYFPPHFWAVNSAQNTAIVWEKDESGYFSTLSTELNWQQFHQLLQQVATLFIQKGITSQSLVAYSGRHRLCGLLTYCTTIAIGAKILMLNPAQSDNQKKAILENVGVDFIIEDDIFANFSPKTTACYTLDKLNFSQPATLTLTSGSTGIPKAAVHSISAHLASAEGVCELMEFEQYHSWLLSLPLFHVSGQGIVWRWLFKGATLYVNQNKDSFFEWLKRVSHCSLVPTQLQRYLTKLIAPISQKCLLGGTNIPANLVMNAQQCGITTFSGYGMTEMASTICAVENELDNVGSSLKHREVKIEQNEIWVKGKSLALGYWQKDGNYKKASNEGICAKIKLL